MSTNMTTNRYKAVFTIWTGPFLLLGAYVIRQQPTSMRFDLRITVLFSILALLYLAIAYIASRIEKYGVEKCNEWRVLIAHLSLSSPETMVTLDEVKDRLPDKDLPKKLRPTYFALFTLMCLSFLTILLIVAP